MDREAAITCLLGDHDYRSSPTVYIRRGRQLQLKTNVKHGLKQFWGTNFKGLLHLTNMLFSLFFLVWMFAVIFKPTNTVKLIQERLSWL